jgi:hypothetical protein
MKSSSLLTGMSKAKSRIAISENMVFRAKVWIAETKAIASFTVEASLLMTVILPVLLALLYYGFFLHDKGVLNGAAQQITAQADLNQWKKTGNNRLGKQAKALEKMTGPSKDVSSSVSVTEKQAKVQYQGTISLPGLLPSLFGKSKLSTGADADRLLLHPADLIRKIRGLEYASALLKGKHA